MFLITIMFLNYSPNTCFACDCARPDNVNEQLDRSTAVFSGEVIEIVDKNKNNSIQSSADPIAVLFKVDESWKGIDQSQVIIYTARDGASCGYEFSLNNKYLVYAQETDGDLIVNICSRTTLLSSSDKDLEELGKGEKPTEQVSINLDAIEAEDKLTNGYIIVITFLFVLLIIVIAYVTRRFRN